MQAQMDTQRVDVSATRSALYETLLQQARKAQTCKVGHHCPRYQHIMARLDGGPTEECEVWDRFPCLTDSPDADSEPEQVFLGTKEECEAYIVEATRGFLGASRYSIEEPSKCGVCDAFDHRKVETAKGIQPPFLIVVSGISRHYGGPEEGGWWYNTTEIVEVRKVHTISAAHRHLRELKELYPQPRFGIGSAANRGESEYEMGCFYGENDPRFPQANTERPRYE